MMKYIAIIFASLILCGFSTQNVYAAAQNCQQALRIANSSPAARSCGHHFVYYPKCNCDVLEGQRHTHHLFTIEKGTDSLRALCLTGKGQGHANFVHIKCSNVCPTLRSVNGELTGC